MKVGNKNDRIDARKLSALLYPNKLNPVYHGEHVIRTLKELARTYIAMTCDLTRVRSRLKAIYRSWAIPCAGSRSMHRATVRNGLRGSQKSAYPGAELSLLIDRGRCGDIWNQHKHVVSEDKALQLAINMVQGVELATQWSEVGYGPCIQVCLRVERC